MSGEASRSPPPPPSVVCFGEVLYDLAPSGKTVGGAPLNVAVHARQLGLAAAVISRVGADEAGDGILAFLQTRGVDATHIGRDDSYATGAVRVTFPRPDDPHYEIVRDAAWDHLPATEEAADAVRASDALVVGTLAARSPATRATLERYAAAANRCVLDVNFRAPFYDRNLTHALLAYASLVKLNDGELDEIAGWNGWRGGREARLRRLREAYALDGVILTRGGAGAEYLDADRYLARPAPRVEVVDTVGSGDAFLAAFLSRHLSGADAETALEFAVGVGAYVARQRGATPTIDASSLP